MDIPVQAILTMRKIKTVLPSLKAPNPKFLRSRVVYKISCPGFNACYVGQTARHIKTRFGEHATKKKQPVLIHFQVCNVGKPQLAQLNILAATTKNIALLETLEALFIEEIKPAVNTKDEFRGRALTIKVC